jgi:NAD(P)-dependent dehydrogenase (short-subunit alcohol dehydrogenase family)
MFGAVSAQEIIVEQWRQYFDVNVLAAVRLIRMCLNGMTTRGRGRAMQIASDSALVTPEEMIHYGVSETAPQSLLQRLIEPAEIANMVAYLASPLASATTGGALRVDGGYVDSIVP